MNVAAIIAELDDHGFSDTSTTRKMAIINSVIWRFLSRADFPFLNGESDITLTAGSSTITLPTDFVRVNGMICASLASVVQPETYDRVTHLYPAALTTSGPPVYYYHIGDTTHASGIGLRTYPIPDQAYTIKLLYRKQQAELSSSDAESAILVPKRWHREIIVNGALARLFAMEDDPENSAVFKALYDEAVEASMADLNLVQTDRPGYIEVPNWDDWDY